MEIPFSHPSLKYLLEIRVIAGIYIFFTKLSNLSDHSGAYDL